MSGYFITGTDTGIGKTWVSCALLQYFNHQGLSTSAMKPVASGCEVTAEGLRNEDALMLMAEASIEQGYDEVNPYSFAPAIAPHIAAQEEGVEIELDVIHQCYKHNQRRSDICIVEGVGGWLVPLDGHHSVADLAQNLALPVIMVVGLRLGCINHALLTMAAIQQSGLSVAGWIANEMAGEMVQQEANIAALSQRLSAPLLGHLPHDPTASASERGLLLQL